MAFLFGVIADRGVKFERAWELPLHLRERLGHLDLHRIAAMKPGALARYVGEHNGRPALHRFVKQMSRALVEASRRVAEHPEWMGRPERIWTGRTAHYVVKAFDEFYGVGHKLAHMAARILVTYAGVPLKDLENIDIAVDRHVARVFLRSGLVRPKERRKSFRIAEVWNEVVATARMISPEFPAALDEPAFVAGLRWCHADGAACEAVVNGSGCPLREVCLRLTGRQVL